jgi:nicotinic acid mononucleotide adenylyltransferase
LYVQLADSLSNLHSIWSNSDFIFWTCTFIGCREQKRYGKTLGGKAVDIGKLSELASLGYNRRVAAEALKQSENDRDMALEMLLNPASLATLQVFTGLAISHVRGA